MSFSYNQLTSVKINNPSASVDYYAFCQNPNLTPDILIGSTTQHFNVGGCER